MHAWAWGTFCAYNHMLGMMLAWIGLIEWLLSWKKWCKLIEWCLCHNQIQFSKKEPWHTTKSGQLATIHIVVKSILFRIHDHRYRKRQGIYSLQHIDKDITWKRTVTHYITWSTIKDVGFKVPSLCNATINYHIKKTLHSTPGIIWYLAWIKSLFKQCISE